MTVDELRAELDKLPGDAPILVSGSDHSYVAPYFRAGTARFVRSENYYCEDSGDDADHRPEELVIQALVGDC